MSAISIAVLVCLLAFAFLPIWPMQYQLFSYDNAIGTTHGFRGRKWLVGQWAALGRGKNSQREARAWMALQSKTTYLFGEVPSVKSSR